MGRGWNVCLLAARAAMIHAAGLLLWPRPLSVHLSGRDGVEMARFTGFPARFALVCLASLAPLPSAFPSHPPHDFFLVIFFPFRFFFSDLKKNNFFCLTYTHLAG